MGILELFPYFFLVIQPDMVVLWWQAVTFLQVMLMSS